MYLLPSDVKTASPRYLIVKGAGDVIATRMRLGLKRASAGAPRREMFMQRMSISPHVSPFSVRAPQLSGTLECLDAYSFPARLAIRSGRR
jgi:hypothetical protein